MVGVQENASKVYVEAIANLAEGLPEALLSEIPELVIYATAYWEIVNFLGERPAMVVGDVLNPGGIVEYMLKEKDEAIEAISDPDNLGLELGDTMFLGLVAAGLLWHALTTEQKETTKETIVWTMDQARKHEVDLPTAVTVVARDKNPSNYLENCLQISPNETVGMVAERLDRVYRMLRRRRDLASGKIRAKYGKGYSHAVAMSRDNFIAGGRYDA